MFTNSTFSCLVLTLALVVVGQLASADQEIITAEVYVDAPGCSLGAPEGTLQIKNLLDDLYLRFEVKADFENPSGAPTTCDGSCGGEGCDCDIVSGTKLDVPPGTTRSTTCSFCSSGGCFGCFNEGDDCLTANMFCSEESNVQFMLLAYSCDGSTWVAYPRSEQYVLSYSVNTVCE